MARRYEAISADKSTRKNWLKVGQQVKIRADLYYGKNGTISAVDKRFRRPYTVKVEMGGGQKKTVHFTANELRITRY